MSFYSTMKSQKRSFPNERSQRFLACYAASSSLEYAHQLIRLNTPSRWTLRFITLSLSHQLHSSPSLSKSSLFRIPSSFNPRRLYTISPTFQPPPLPILLPHLSLPSHRTHPSQPKNIPSVSSHNPCISPYSPSPLLAPTPTSPRFQPNIIVPIYDSSRFRYRRISCGLARRMGGSVEGYRALSGRERDRMNAIARVGGLGGSYGLV